MATPQFTTPNRPPTPQLPFAERLAKKDRMTEKDILEMQEREKVEAFQIKNFGGLPIDVVFTTQKKPGRGAQELNQDALTFDQQTKLIGVTDGVSQSAEAAKAARELASGFQDAVRLFAVDARDKDIAYLVADLELNNTKNGIDRLGDPDRSLGLALQTDEGLVRKAWLLLKSAQEINAHIRKVNGQATAIFSLFHQAKDGKVHMVSISFGDCALMTGEEQINKEHSFLTKAINEKWINPADIPRNPVTGEIDSDTQVPILLPNGKTVARSYAQLRNALSAAFGDPDQDPVLDITFREVTKNTLLTTDGVSDRLEKNEKPDTTKIFGFKEGRTPRAWLNTVREEAISAKSYKRPDDTTAIGVLPSV
ncbi:hypothetical protein KBD61_00200 [Patescibacteria group bacterium]|nr:hypothetical protein [Patescibacteria group bacterium]MBP9709431.1 hypothetical protein [Patescibacteria group bacterium]